MAPVLEQDEQQGVQLPEGATLLTDQQKTDFLKTYKSPDQTGYKPPEKINSYQELKNHVGQKLDWADDPSQIGGVATPQELAGRQPMEKMSVHKALGPHYQFGLIGDVEDKIRSKLPDPNRIGAKFTPPGYEPIELGKPIVKPLIQNESGSVLGALEGIEDKLASKLPDPGGIMATQKAYREQYDSDHPLQAQANIAVQNFMKGQTTPENLAMLVSMPASRVLSLIFAAQAAAGTYKSADAAYDAFKEGRNPEGVRYAVEAGLSAGMAGMAGWHGIGGKLALKDPAGVVLGHIDPHEVAAYRQRVQAQRYADWQTKTRTPPKPRFRSVIPKREPVAEPEGPGGPPPPPGAPPAPPPVPAAAAPPEAPPAPAGGAPAEAAPKPEEQEPIVAATGGALQAPPAGATPAAEAIAGKAVLTQELEPDLLDAVMRRMEIRDQVHGDLAEVNVHPHDYPAIIDHIAAQGEAAWNSGNYTEAINQAVHHHLLEKTLGEVMGMSPEQAAARARQLAAEHPMSTLPGLFTPEGQPGRWVQRPDGAWTIEPIPAETAAAEAEAPVRQLIDERTGEAPPETVPRGTAAPEEPVPPAAEPKAEEPVTPTPEAQPAPEAKTTVVADAIKKTGKGKPRTRKPKAAEPVTPPVAPPVAEPPGINLADHFRPGNVILSNYWKKHDKVLKFQPSAEGKPWAVQVIESDKDGNPVPGAQPRWHATYPDAKDQIVKQGEPGAPAPPPTAAAEPVPPAPSPEKLKLKKEGNAWQVVGKPVTIELTDSGFIVSSDGEFVGRADSLTEAKQKAKAFIDQVDKGIEKAKEAPSAGVPPQAAVPPEPVTAPTPAPEEAKPSEPGAAAAPEPPKATPGIGKYSAPDLREIFKAADKQPGAAEDYQSWLNLPDDQMVQAAKESGIDEHLLDYITREYGQQWGIKLPSQAAPEIPRPAPVPAPPVPGAAGALRPNSPEVTAALTNAGLHDASTLRVINRAVQQGAIQDADQLNDFLAIASAIKKLDPTIPNISAIHEASHYANLEQLERIASAREGEYPQETIDRAKEVWKAARKPLVSAAKVAGGKIKMGADPKALAEVLGSSLYGKNPAAVIVKELMQNSWDAIRRSKGTKNVTVEFQRWPDRITITDTGLGMTRKELETVFTDLGRTGKLTQADASGGFGIAKAAPFMMTKQLTVTTVAEEGGKLYRHTFTSTPDTIVGKGVEIHSEELSRYSGVPLGTTIEAELNPDADTYEAEIFAGNSRRSLNPPGGLEVKGLPSYRDEPISPINPKPIATDTIPGANIKLFTGPETETARKWQQVNVEINNNGIYQFDFKISPPTEGMKIPKRVAIDVKATVKERDPDYPFMANREDFRSQQAKDQIRDLIKTHIFEAAVKEHNQEVADAMHGLPSIKVGAIDIPIFDSGKRLTPEEIDELKSDPAFIDLAHTVHKVTRDAITKLQSADLPAHLANLGQKVKKIGMVFSDKLHGVHITDPNNKDYVMLFINPLQDIKGNSERASSLIWHTIKHELIHDAIAGHYESFTSAESAVAGALGSRSELAAITELEDVYGDPANPGTIRPDLSRAIQLYEGSRGRAETAKDIFGGEGLRGAGAAGREVGIPDRGEGTLSSELEQRPAKGDLRRQLIRFDPNAKFGELGSAALVAPNGKVAIGDYHHNIANQVDRNYRGDYGTWSRKFFKNGGVRVRADNGSHIEFGHGNDDPATFERVRDTIHAIPGDQLSVEYFPPEGGRSRWAFGGKDEVLAQLDDWEKGRGRPAAPYGTSEYWRQQLERRKGTPERIAALGRLRSDNADSASATASERFGVPVIAANDDAMVLLDRVGGRDGKAIGKSISGAKADKLIPLLQEYVANDPKNRQGLADFINLLKNHRTPNGNVIVHNKGMTDAELDNTIFHEGFHDWQHSHLTPSDDNMLAMDKAMQNSPSATLWQAAKYHLQSYEYHPEVTHLEIPAWIAAGDHADLGIFSAEDAAKVMADYLENARKILGDEAVDALHPMDPTLKENLDAENRRRDTEGYREGAEGRGSGRVDSDGQTAPRAGVGGEAGAEAEGTGAAGTVPEGRIGDIASLRAEAEARRQGLEARPPNEAGRIRRGLRGLDPNADHGEPNSAALISGDGQIAIGDYHVHIKGDVGYGDYGNYKYEEPFFNDGGVRVRSKTGEINIEFGNTDPATFERVRNVIDALPGNYFILEYKGGRGFSVGDRKNTLNALDRWENARNVPRPGSVQAFRQRDYGELEQRPATKGNSVRLRDGRETLKQFGLDPDKTHGTRDIAEALETRQRQNVGTIAPDDRTPESSQKIAKWMVDEIEHERLTPEKSGVGWYSAKFQRALDRFAIAFPELEHNQHARDLLTALIAITSDGNKVIPNFKMAADIYGNYRKTGDLTTAIGHQRKASINNNLGKIKDLLDAHGPEGMHKYLLREETVGELKKLATEEGIKFSTEYQAHVKLPMAALIFGPKLGAFYANLMGAEGYLTMDRWWSRSFNRYRGTLVQQPSKKLMRDYAALIGHPEYTDRRVLKHVEGPREALKDRGFKTVLALLMGKSEPGNKAEKAEWMEGVQALRSRRKMDAALERTAKEVEESGKATKTIVNEDGEEEEIPVTKKEKQRIADGLRSRIGSATVNDLLQEHKIERSANTIYKTAFENLEDSPFNPTDRTFMLDTAKHARKLLKDKGIDMTVADIQAVLWYYEKRLYGKLGARQTADISYEEAANRVIEERADRDRPAGRPVSGVRRVGAEAGAEGVHEAPAETHSAAPGHGPGAGVARPLEELQDEAEKGRPAGAKKPVRRKPVLVSQ